MLEGISMFDELQIRPRYAVGLLCLGELYGNEGRTEKALENPKKVEGILQEMGIAYWLDKTKKLFTVL